MGEGESIFLNDMALVGHFHPGQTHFQDQPADTNWTGDTQRRLKLGGKVPGPKETWDKSHLKPVASSSTSHLAPPS